MWRQRDHEGFSLVETLVVVSTTALLLGMLLPSLQTARQQAQKTTCLSNLRQMAIAAQSYGEVYDQHYPVAYYNRQEGEILRFYSWDFTLWKQWSGATATTHVEAGLLWMGQAVDKVQQCPAFKGASNTVADPYTGYNYNTSYIGLIDTMSPVGSARITDVGRPAETTLFGDGQCPTGGANKYMRAPFSHPGDTLLPDSARCSGAQGYRHMRQTNLAFCDGHVGPWSEISTQTDPVGKKTLDACNSQGGVPIGFLSSDNSLYDLK
ncbi:MAG: DUF1559 domain-containing protein [Phycisphaerales bacterium]